MIIAENRKVYQNREGETLISLGYNDVVSFSEKKTSKIKGIGQKFSKINSFFFDFLKGYNLPIGFLALSEDKSLVFQNHFKFPFCIKVLNVVDKRTSKIFEKNENESLAIPVYEIHYGNGKESIINESHLISLDICSVEDLKMMFRIASKVNVVLKSFFERRNSMLTEAMCYFGKLDERIFLVNDFTPQSIKIIASSDVQKKINPYRLTNSESVKDYTDYLLNFTTN